MATGHATAHDPDAARVAALSAGCADFEEEWEFLNKKLKALTLFAGVPALGEAGVVHVVHVRGVPL